MTIFKRPPGDTFTFRLFFELTSKITVPHDKIYIWSSVLDPIYDYGWWDFDGKWKTETELDYRHKLVEIIKSDLVVIGLKDHLTSENFDFYNDKYPAIVEYLINLFQFYSNKKFILFTTLEGLDRYIKLPNVNIIPWGGDITNHQIEYQKLNAVIDKNLDSKFSFLSLNRNDRIHRARLVSLLYGLNIQSTGLISCMFKDNIDNSINATQWNTDSSHIYELGCSRLKDQGTNIVDNREIYKNDNNDNVSNFRNKLIPYYKETFVEIVSETSFTEECFNLTEKTLNSVYGQCFPIFLCSKGTVDFLRIMGLDTFDDVIDHSYDNILDPAKRLETAINNNIKLLTDVEYAKSIWIKNKTRFEKNIDFCKKELYNYYRLRANSKIDRLINEYNL